MTPDLRHAENYTDGERVRSGFPMPSYDRALRTWWIRWTP